MMELSTMPARFSLAMVNGREISVDRVSEPFVVFVP